jgi:hypothetical protein
LYHLGPLAEGDYRVELRDGLNPIKSAGDADGSVHVQAGEVTRVEMTYGGYAGRIVGRVLDSSGMPLENVWVTAQGSGVNRNDIGQMLTPVTHANERRSLTNADGRFALDGLMETATFSVVASHALGGEARVEGVSVGRDVELRLTAPGRVGGVVLNDDGRPVTHFQISISNNDSGQHMSSEFGPDAQGKWFVDHVAPGTVTISARTSEGFASVVRELGPAQHLNDIELRILPSASAQN